MGYITKRIYLSDSAPDVSPSFRSFFNNTGAAIRRKGTLTRGTTALATKQITGMRNTTHLAVQFVSEPMGLSAAMYRITGLVRGKASVFEGTGVNDRRVDPKINLLFCSEDGATWRNTAFISVSDAVAPPYFSTGHSYIDSTSFRAQDFDLAWTAPVVYTGDANIVPTDRLVIWIGFDPFVPTGEPDVDATYEYGETGGDPLSDAAPDDAGYGFFDLHIYSATSRYRSRVILPVRRPHAPERLSTVAAQSEPMLGEGFLGQ